MDKTVTIVVDTKMEATAFQSYLEKMFKMIPKSLITFEVKSIKVTEP